METVLLKKKETRLKTKDCLWGLHSTHRLQRMLASYSALLYSHLSSLLCYLVKFFKVSLRVTCKRIVREVKTREVKKKKERKKIKEAARHFVSIGKYY